ncbi:MAG: hypothetical protein ACREMB_14570 [Candidatus Rokuibacteriota bacterium]
MIRSVDIAWLTGLLEGEGHFCMSGRSIMIAVTMTDRKSTVYRHTRGRLPRMRVTTREPTATPS